MTTTDPRVEPGPEPAPERRRARGNVVIIAVSVLITVGVLAGGLLTVVAAFESQQAKADESMIRSAVNDAVLWQQTYGVENARFTTDRQILADQGWRPAFDVDIHLISAGPDTFCMAAGPIGEPATLWADQSGILADRSCE